MPWKTSVLLRAPLVKKKDSSMQMSCHNKNCYNMRMSETTGKVDISTESGKSKGNNYIINCTTIC